MSIKPALGIFLAALGLLLVTVVLAILYGKKMAKRQAARRQDTERGMKISPPMLSVPRPVKNPDALHFVPSTRAERVTKIKPLPNHGGWI